MKRAPSIAALLLLATACTEPEQEFGEVILEVGTDMPVPSLVSRLRVDTYLEDGTWFGSRDLFLNEPSDWPASFSLVRPSEDARRFLVRLRAYPDGKLRDYRGEQFVAPPTWEPPAVPTRWGEVCETAVRLELGGTATVRVARQPFGGLQCPDEESSGIASAVVDIPPEMAGEPVRFEVLGSDPEWTVRLQLQRECDPNGTALGCVEGGINTPNPFVEEVVSAGRYHLFVAMANLLTQRDTNGDIYGVTLPAPADITVAAYPVGSPRPVPPEAALEETATGTRVMTLSGGVTPPFEPQPSLAIDRLVVVEIAPGQTTRRSVLMRGECVGTPALLGGDDPTEWGLDASQTCVDVGGARLPVATASSSDDDLSAPRETFGQSKPCEAADLDPNAVCVPGGTFVMGSPQGSGAVLSTVPERVVRLDKFWIDRNEVTVGDVRREFREGIADLPLWDQPTLNPQPLGSVGQLDAEGCTFSNEQLGREDYPINCVNWTFARAFCRNRGGDLPTAAQWEYVATAAWRMRETTFPWGNDEPSCSRAVYGRATESPCEQAVNGVEPVANNLEDATPGTQPVLGLTGNVAEWVLDALRPYDHPCWRQSSIDGRTCREPEAPYRTLRGGFWQAFPRSLPSARHFGAGALSRTTAIGFRCAYEERPP